MLKQIIEAPFGFVGWLLKDTYGRVVSIAVLYPSIKAALIQPVEAMRHR